jgi:hypothetical protein
MFPGDSTLTPGRPLPYGPPLAFAVDHVTAPSHSEVRR